MIVRGVEYVGWEDSYLLGWENADGVLMLFVQVLLAEGHSGYRPFDENTVHGCYRLGILRFGPAAACRGLPAMEREPKWDRQLGEFQDVAEIDSIAFTESGCLMCADDLDLEIAAASAELTLAEGEDQDAFK